MMARVQVERLESVEVVSPPPYNQMGKATCTKLGGQMISQYEQIILEKTCKYKYTYQNVISLTFLGEVLWLMLNYCLYAT